VYHLQKKKPYKGVITGIFQIIPFEKIYET